MTKDISEIWDYIPEGYNYIFKDKDDYLILTKCKPFLIDAEWDYYGDAVRLHKNKTLTALMNMFPILKHSYSVLERPKPEPIHHTIVMEETRPLTQPSGFTTCVHDGNKTIPLYTYPPSGDVPEWPKALPPHTEGLLNMHQITKIRIDIQQEIYEGVKKNGIRPQVVANLLIDNWEYIAMEENGDWYAYENGAPERVFTGIWIGDCTQDALPFKINYTGDWKDSLFKKEE